jgi:hypothetical protein
LLVTGMRYFFRREVETDQELFQGLTFSRIEDISKAQAEGFSAIDQALAQHGARLEELLGDLHADVLDIKAEMTRYGQQMRELSAAVLQALDQHRLAQQRELRASDSLSIRSEPERRLVKALVGRYRSLPQERRRELPALLNALAKLEVASGDFTAAQEDFRTVATLVPADPHAQAVAHYNEYQAALEQRRWPAALAALRRRTGPRTLRPVSVPQVRAPFHPRRRRLRRGVSVPPHQPRQPSGNQGAATGRPAPRRR